MKVKLKTIQELIEDGWIFDDDGEFFNPTSGYTFPKVSMKHLGKIMDNEGSWSSSVVSEIIEEKNADNGYREDQFNAYLHKDGDLLLALIDSKDDNDYKNGGHYTQITLR